MIREKLGRKEIERVFEEYSQLFSTLGGEKSPLSEADRLMLVKQYRIGYEIAEHYLFHKQNVDELDVFFIFAEKGLAGLKNLNKQMNEQKRYKKSLFK